MSPKGRHTSYTLQIPLATPESNPKKIMKKGNASQEGISNTVPCDSRDSHDSYFKTPVVVSNSPFISSTGVSEV